MDKAIRKGFSKEAAFEWKPECSKRIGYETIWGKMFPGRMWVILLLGST